MVSFAGHPDFLSAVFAPQFARRRGCLFVIPAQRDPIRIWNSAPLARIVRTIVLRGFGCASQGRKTRRAIRSEVNAQARNSACALLGTCHPQSHSASECGRDRGAIIWRIQKTAHERAPYPLAQMTSRCLGWVLIRTPPNFATKASASACSAKQKRVYSKTSSIRRRRSGG
jgi:hypothetical protein